MIKHVLIAFDGTGSLDWKRTDRNIAGYGLNSHVSRFWQDFNTEPRFKKYYEGPGTLGGESNAKVNDALNWLGTRSGIFRDLNQSQTKICIIGHSRGAVSAIQFVNALKSGNSQLRMEFSQWVLPITVDFLGLYDTVDRDISGFDAGEGLRDTTYIYHARRRNIGFSGSRTSFSSEDIGRSHYAADFDTSHGGIGGDPGFFQAIRTGVLSYPDFYCNALQVILNERELRTYGISADGNALFPPLVGNAKRRRIEQLRGFYIKVEPLMNL